MKRTAAAVEEAVILAYTANERVDSICGRFTFDRATLFKILKRNSVPLRSVVNRKPFVIYKERKYTRIPRGYFRHGMSPNCRHLHRDIWEDHFGPIPPRYHIHHKDGDVSNNAIENLECLSPEDHASHHHKGKTGFLGEANYGAVLTEQQVTEIRRLYRTGKYTQYELADRFSVSQSLISMIVHGQIWPHLTEPPCPKKRKSPIRLDQAQKDEIKARYEAGVAPQHALAKEHGVSQGTVSNIITGRY